MAEKTEAVMESENPIMKRSRDELDTEVSEKKAKLEIEKVDAEKEEELVLGPKKFCSSVDMFDYFYKIIHAWPSNLNLNKIRGEKCLVIDPKHSGSLSFIVQSSKLKFQDWKASLKPPPVDTRYQTETMNQEYTAGEFRKVADTLIEMVPGMQITTDIICETDEDFEEIVNLINEYKFSQVRKSQFFPRPGTPAARMQYVPSNVEKKQSCELTTVFESFTPYVGMEGRIEKIWINDIALITVTGGHKEGYIQVLVQGSENLLSTSDMIKVTNVGRWSVLGEIIEILTKNATSPKTRSSNYTKCSDSTETYCSNTEESCACELTSSLGKTDQKIVTFKR